MGESVSRLGGGGGGVCESASCYHRLMGQTQDFMEGEGVGMGESVSTVGAGESGTCFSERRRKMKSGLSWFSWCVSVLKHRHEHKDGVMIALGFTWGTRAVSSAYQALSTGPGTI